jgi:hypothetical protein
MLPEKKGASLDHADGMAAGPEVSDIEAGCEVIEIGVGPGLEGSGGNSPKRRECEGGRGRNLRTRAGQAGD